MKCLIIFDFFGVISSEISVRWFNKRNLDSKDYYFGPADLGERSFLETIDLMSRDLGYSSSDILAELKSYAKLNYELISYIKSLRDNNYVALLSNAPADIFEVLYPELDLNGLFDKVFISSNYKMKKPNLDFYKLCLNSFGNVEAIMIDDNISNLNLSSIGIKGMLYKSNEDLFKKL